MSKQHIHIIFEYPPIPDRSCDWRAYYDGEEEENKCGWGSTPTEACKNLLDWGEEE